MNNLAKITLADEVAESRLCDGLRQETPPQEAPNEQAPKKKKFSFKFKKPSFNVKNLGLKKKGKKLSKAAVRKNALVACCVLLIGVAVWLNFSFAENDGLSASADTAVQGEGKILGESTFVSSEAPEEDYFSVAVINRQRVRDEAIDMLREVVDNVETNSAIRENAFNEMTRMAGETNSEINIENLITAKGFEECVAVINGDSANIIVKCDTLRPEQIAQIQEIVYTQSGTAIENIKIIEKQ